MEYQDLYRLMAGLNSVSGLPGVTFGYAVAKNFGRVERGIKAHRKNMEMSDEYKAFDELRTEICKAHAELGDNGKPKRVNNEYVIVPSKKAKFNKAVDVLKKNHPVAVKARENQADNFNKSMDEEMKNPVVLHKVSKDDLPEQIVDNRASPPTIVSPGINGQQQYTIREMIEGLEDDLEEEKPKPKKKDK